jgi:prepilin-type N-terminal cleavage/methylation domain-containing protein
VGENKNRLLIRAIFWYNYTRIKLYLIIQIIMNIRTHYPQSKGFTLVELLLVISIISLLSSMILVSYKNVTGKAYASKTKQEMKQISYALELYAMDNNYSYPCDVSRDLPPGIEKYLSSNHEWPKAPWPGSVYDWDYWDPDSGSTGGCAGDLAQNPKTTPVYQISIRFCDISGTVCRFPNGSWASNFDAKSSVYWCISGSCRAHGSMEYNHPGCCIGGNCPIDQLHCNF